MEKKIINIKTKEEVNNMNVENTAIDAVLRERFITLSNLINELKTEKDKIQEIVLEKYGHVSVKTGEVFKAVVYDTMTIDEQKIIALYGQETLDLIKTKPKHVEYIKV